jgi:23S rRNA pseudouridine1911/1915/1917 synthase
MSAKPIKNTTDKKQRADVLLANAYPEYSRAALAKLFDLGKVVLDGDVSLSKAGDKIKPGQSIIADLSELEKPVESIELPIIYEDNNVVVVDKPTGVISHARGRFWQEASVASFIRDKLKGPENERSGIVHRLDRATSGIMICAKNPDTMRFLQKQFALRKVKKEYLAIIFGHLDPKEAIIDVPLARDPKKPQTFKADPTGKSAITEYLVLSENKKHSLVKLMPKTGRSHQLRVHLKYIGHPIVGDELYAGERAERLMLHASSLEITLPTNERKIFISDTPELFSKYI